MSVSASPILTTTIPHSELNAPPVGCCSIHCGDFQ